MSLGGWHKSMVNKYSGNPGLLFVATVGGLVGTYLFVRNFYSPFRRRQKLQQAKEYADVIIQNENSLKNVDE